MVKANVLIRRTSLSRSKGTRYSNRPGGNAKLPAFLCSVLFPRRKAKRPANPPRPESFKVLTLEGYVIPIDRGGKPQVLPLCIRYAPRTHKRASNTRTTCKHNATAKTRSNDQFPRNVRDNTGRTPNTTQRHSTGRTTANVTRNTGRTKRSTATSKPTQPPTNTSTNQTR